MGTLIADSCGNAVPTISNPSVMVVVIDNVIRILSDAAVVGPYDEQDCTWRGEGLTTIPPRTLVREVYDGTWSQDAMGIVFRGTLTFIFIDLTTQEEICRWVYQVELRRVAM